jgi:hypothetical protein
MDKINSGCENDCKNDLFVDPTGYSDDDLEDDLEDDSDDLFDINNNLDNSNKILKTLINNVKKYQELKKNNKEPDKDFKNDYEIIKYLYKEGYLNNNDLEETIVDSCVLYELFLNILNNKQTDVDIDIAYALDDERVEFEKYIKENNIN